MEKIKVLIAGIAGASLGTEVLKCLRLCDHYEIYGCDISPLAYGLYEEDFTRTFCIDRSHYIEQILSLCSQYGIKVIVPGAEEPTQLLSDYRHALSQQGIVLAGNEPAIISVCSDKTRCFDLLKSQIGRAHV